MSHGRIRRLLALEPRPLFEGFRELGASLRATSHGRLHGCLRRLGELDGRGSLMAEIALGHGALAESPAPLSDAAVATIDGLCAGWAQAAAIRSA